MPAASRAVRACLAFLLFISFDWLVDLEFQLYSSTASAYKMRLVSLFLRRKILYWTKSSTRVDNSAWSMSIYYQIYLVLILVVSDWLETAALWSTFTGRLLQFLFLFNSSILFFYFDLDSKVDALYLKVVLHLSQNCKVYFDLLRQLLGIFTSKATTTRLVCGLCETKLQS